MHARTTCTHYPIRKGTILELSLPQDGAVALSVPGSQPCDQGATALATESPQTSTIHSCLLHFAAARALFGAIWAEPWRIIEENKNNLTALGEALVERIGIAPLPTSHGDFTLVAYGDRTTGQEHFALVKGDFLEGALGNGEDVLVRIHSSCVTSEVFDAINCECPQQKETALQEIAKAPCGVLIYLHQEGRGNGTKGKMVQLANMFRFEQGVIVHERDTEEAFLLAGYEAERRDFTVAGAILVDLAVKSVRILTNNPKKIDGLRSQGISVLSRQPIEIPATNAIIAKDLQAKKRMGHLLR